MYNEGYNGDEKNTETITKPKKQRPEIIRYSNIIKSDIEEVNFSIKRTLNSLKLDEMEFNDENDLKRLFHTITDKIKSDFDIDGLGEINLENLNEIISVFNNFIQDIESNINSFMFPQKIIINLFN